MVVVVALVCAGRGVGGVRPPPNLVPELRRINKFVVT